MRLRFDDRGRAPPEAADELGAEVLAFEALGTFQACLYERCCRGGRPLRALMPAGASSSETGWLLSSRMALTEVEVLG